jgi:hypothetical protein
MDIAPSFFFAWTSVFFRNFCKSFELKIAEYENTLFFNCENQ